MLFLIALLWQTTAPAPSPTVLNLEIDPSQYRAPIEFAVSWQRPTLVVFNRVPDGKIINGDTENWFIGAPPQTPDHTFHFKPKSQAPGMLANSFLFFDGYPVELVYHAAGPDETPRSLVYIRVRPAPNSVIDLASKAPQFKSLPKRQPEKSVPVAGSAVSRTKKLPYGKVTWVLGSRNPNVFFQPRAHMAGLESVEVVRARKPWFGGIRKAQPLTKTFQRTEEGYHVNFELVHLSRGEHYYLRLFFKGSKRPVYVRLRGYGGL